MVESETMDNPLCRWSGYSRIALSTLALFVFSACGPNFSEVVNLDSSGRSIICFGDSITRGHGAEPGLDYPAILAELLGRPVVNAGKDGDTTGIALERLERDVLDHNPRLVILGLGGNDFLQRRSHSDTARDLERIVSRCTASGAMVVVVHAKFGLFRDPYLEDYQEVATRHGALLVKNVLRGVLGNPERMSDQIHPNSLGYLKIAERVHEVVAPLLEAADAARNAEN
jgi:acyl-CoA thioesterase I